MADNPKALSRLAKDILEKYKRLNAASSLDEKKDLAQDLEEAKKYLRPYNRWRRWLKTIPIPYTPATKLIHLIKPPKKLNRKKIDRTRLEELQDLAYFTAKLGDCYVAFYQNPKDDEFFLDPQNRSKYEIELLRKSLVRLKYHVEKAITRCDGSLDTMDSVIEKPTNVIKLEVRKRGRPKKINQDRKTT